MSIVKYLRLSKVFAKHVNMKYISVLFFVDSFFCSGFIDIFVFMLCKNLFLNFQGVAITFEKNVLETKNKYKTIFKLNSW